MMFTMHSAAAISPGISRPTVNASEPSAGPIATPALVAAEIQPRLFARCSGSVASATYAWITPVVPPPAPCTTLERRRSQRLVEYAKTT
jgi:hypothetical protein